MNLKYVTKFGDITTAYVLGRLEERALFALRYMHQDDVYIIYPVEELINKIGCSYSKCIKILDRLEKEGYLIRTHDLDGPDKLYLPHLMDEI